MLAVKQRISHWQDKQKNSVRFGDTFQDRREAPLWARESEGDAAQKRGRRLSNGGNSAILVKFKTDKSTCEAPKETNGTVVDNFNAASFDDKVHRVRAKRPMSDGALHHVYDVADANSSIPQSHSSSSADSEGVELACSNGSMENHWKLPPIVQPYTQKKREVGA